MRKQYYFHRKCNFCGGVKKATLFLFGQQKLVRCLKCGIVYFDKQRTDLEDIYNENYYVQSESNNASYYNYYSRDQEALMKGTFGFAYQFIKEKIRENRNYNLLDIGAGFGYFLNYLPRKVEPSAVELSKLAVEEIKKLGVKCYQKNFLEVKFTEKYDFLTAFDVMEHQINLKKFLIKTREIIKPEGYFLFTVPDFGSFLNRLMGKRAPVIQPLYHNYYFEKDWFFKNLGSLGWEIISLKSTYFTKMILDHLVLMASLSFPSLEKFKLNQFLQRKNWGGKVVPFLRMGGIEGVIKRIEN